ncbi:DinB family protein [Microlunatus sp. GCM10028923]|uniref:DinB family protein n=1 Tax=Microlunatus sp. GCM10028923 TaxID=3273400 RepID=UPI0036245EDB
MIDDARTFLGTDLSGARFRDVVLVDAKITGLITGLTVNDVEVEPLINAELDRRHPERILLRSADPDDLGRGWRIVREQWSATLARIRALPGRQRRERVDGEWSALETLRHLIFVADDWFGRTVRGEAQPYWPAGLVPSFLEAFHPEQLGIDLAADPDLAAIEQRWTERTAQLDAWLATLTEAELARECPSSFSSGAGATLPARTCLHAVLEEFAAHRRYAERDLDRLVTVDGK